MFVPGFNPLLFTPVTLTGGVSGDTLFHDANFGGVTSARVVGPTNAFSISGIVAYGDGAIIFLVNRTGFTITLEDEDTASTAANRFSLGGSDITIADGKNVMLYYDSNTSRWHRVNNA